MREDGKRRPKLFVFLFVASSLAWTLFGMWIKPPTTYVFMEDWAPSYAHAPTASSVNGTAPRVPFTAGPFGRMPVGRVFFMTYGDSKYVKSTRRLSEEARDQGLFDEVFVFGPEDISSEFKSRPGPARILDQRRGGGYWLWKPYFVHHLMMQVMKEGDVLVYADAGCELKRSVAPLIEQAAGYGLVAFRMGFLMGKYTKGAAFAALKMDPQVWGREPQIMATTFVIQKRAWTMELVQRWLELSSIPEVITDQWTNVPNLPEFRDHRHDQAIWSLLLYKFGAQLILHDYTHPNQHTIISASRLRE